MADRNVYHLTPHANGWQVKGEGSDDREILVDDKDRALELAREMAHANEPSQVIVHTRDGKIETEYTYGDDPRGIPG